MRLPYILWWVGIEAFTFIIVFLYNVPYVPYIHGSLILLVAVLVIGGVDFFRIKRKHQLLLDNHVNDVEPDNFIEEDYLNLLEESQMDSRIAQDQTLSMYNDMVEYYTIWAHQIKTPLAGIYLTVQNIEDDELRQTLSSELVRTNEYVDMVMNYLRLQSNDSDYVFERVLINDIVRQEIRRMKTLFMSKKIGVSFEPEASGNIYANSDKRWLGFALGQVLTNSVKYSSGGTITITVNDDYIEVKDQGIGISEEDIPRIFEKGYTGYNGRSDKKSTGIGLYLVKRAMTSIGGDITIESTQGEGTTARLIYKVS